LRTVVSGTFTVLRRNRKINAPAAGRVIESRGRRAHAVEGSAAADAASR